MSNFQGPSLIDLSANERYRRSILRASVLLLVGGVLALVTLTQTACRTTEGIGRDVEALGDNVADSADRNKPK